MNKLLYVIDEFVGLKKDYTAVSALYKPEKKLFIEESIPDLG